MFHLGFEWTNVIISTELNFSDELHWVASKVYMNPELHESLRGSFTLHATQCSLHFDKPQKNEIHSLTASNVKCHNVLHQAAESQDPFAFPSIKERTVVSVYRKMP